MVEKIENKKFKEEDFKEIQLSVDTLAAGSYSTSPSCYHANMQLELTNKKKFVSRPEMNKLREKGFIDDTDIFLLKKVYYYKFITRYLLEKSLKLDDSIPEQCKRADYRKRIRKLVSCGILLRYVMMYEDAPGHTTSTPGYLTLSQGAKEYIFNNTQVHFYFPFLAERKRKDLYSCEEILKLISFAQFDVNFIEQEKVMLKENKRDITISSKGHEVTLPAVYRYNIDSYMKGSYIVPIPVRSSDEFEREILKTLQTCETYSSSNKKEKIFEQPIYILICENSTQGHKLMSYLKKHGFGKDVPLLFIFDRNTFSDSIMNNLSKINIVGNDFEIKMQKMGVQ